MRSIFTAAAALLVGIGAHAAIITSVSPLPTYDTTELHAKALVAAALE